MPVRLDALAVEDGCAGSFATSFLLSDAGPQGVVDASPCMITFSGAENMVDGLPRREVRRQESPGNATLENVEDAIDDPTSVRRWAPPFAGRRKHRNEKLPLIIAEISVVGGGFHRPDRLRRIGRRIPPKGMSRVSAKTCHFPVPKLIHATRTCIFRHALTAPSRRLGTGGILPSDATHSAADRIPR